MVNSFGECLCQVLPGAYILKFTTILLHFHYIHYIHYSKCSRLLHSLRIHYIHYASLRIYYIHYGFTTFTTDVRYVCTTYASLRIYLYYAPCSIICRSPSSFPLNRTPWSHPVNHLVVPSDQSSVVPSGRDGEGALGSLRAICFTTVGACHAQGNHISSLDTIVGFPPRHALTIRTELTGSVGVHKGSRREVNAPAVGSCFHVAELTKRCRGHLVSVNPPIGK